MSAAAFPVTRERDELNVSSRGDSFSILFSLDLPLVFAVVGLTLVGIYSLSGAVNGITALMPTAKKQLFFFGVAGVAMMASCLIHYRWLNRLAMLLYVLNIGALIFTLVGGSRINGARSWIDIGPVNWQPAETMKIATVLVCAQWLALHSDKLQGWSAIFIPGLICGAPALLILMQPDLGTASLFFVMFLSMMLMAGVDRRKLGLLLFAAMLGVCSAYPFLKPYQKARIGVFMNPELDPQGKGYNVIQSKVAIGAGGILGDGWGQGSQSIHRFLPEHHTDFIFAATVEQFGLLGGLIVIGGFGLIFWRMIRAMDNARDRFGGIVVAGLIAVVASHLFLNAGMTMGMVPCTGIPLPLFSYGGSFIVTSYILFGLVLNVASRRYTFIGQ
ncbi:rod shape-determining protein RodA [soil metagenome]